MPKDPFKFYANDSSRKQLNEATLYVTECMSQKQKITEILLNSKKHLGYYLDTKFIHRLYRQNRINPMTSKMYDDSDDMQLINVDKKEIKTFTKWNEDITYKAIKHPGSIWESVYKNNINKNIDQKIKALLDMLSETI